ncbi:DNA-binding protein [Novosphingobium sp.]|uniref:DNA-binding protein n=1 Tax=Novosphingobium sp. TaxID=1874826 RepID=UPI00286DBE7D|nr:DNA-binding protein [Novosphingobium sp.]
MGIRALMDCDLGQPLAFFCSQSCPGDVILKAQDWANARRSDDAPVISGFHTPVERDVLRILLRGSAPVIQVLARALDGARLPAALRSAEKEGRALIVSQFAANVRQTTARTAEQRNRYILTRAATIVFAHASLGGKTEALAAEAVALGLPVFTLASPSNANLTGMGAQVV